MKNNQNGYIGIIIVILILIIFIAPFFVFRQVKLNTIHRETFTIKELPDRTFQKNADGTDNQYANLIYAENEVYENVDSWFPLKTRSSDVRNGLEEGKTYDCEVFGWRVGLFSWYKNIDDCKEVE